jgi:hypothetical protein
MATGIGLCYYDLGFYEDAENKQDIAKSQSEICLKINRNFSEVQDANRKLEASGQSDWYRWWFGDEHKDEKDAGKDNKKGKEDLPSNRLLVL